MTRRANHVRNKSYIIHHDLTFLDLSTQPTDRHAPLHITRYMQTQATQVNKNAKSLETTCFYAKISRLFSEFHHFSELAFLVLSTQPMDRDPRLHVARYI